MIVSLDAVSHRQQSFYNINLKSIYILVLMNSFMLSRLENEQSKLLFEIKKSLNPENLENLDKSGKIRKPDEMPEKRLSYQI